MSEKLSREPSTDVEQQASVQEKSTPDQAIPALAVHHFPEGGRKGWMAVVGCWAAMFFTFGYLNAFGVYEAYYLKGPLRHHSPSEIAWIGSIQLFCQFSAGLISGPINDRFGPRVIIVPFSLLLAASIMITSVCKEYYQFLLNQGVLGGISCGLVYAPAVAVVGHYFHRKRPLAMGIAASGSALAGILFPIIIDQLLNHSSLGFGWTQRIVGFIILALCLVACVTIQPGVPPRKGTYLLPEAFKNWAYNYQIIGLFLICWGLFTPFFYLPTYAQEHGVGVGLSFYLITILNAGSFVGRLAGGGFGVALGQFNVIAVCCAACSILIFCWLRITSNAPLILFAALYGFFSGAVIGTMISTIAQVAPHPSQIGTYLGMGSGIFAIAALTGTPITGAMIAHYGRFTEAIIFSGTVALAGSFFMILARISYASKGTWRA